jgi:hypothetical protein
MSVKESSPQPKSRDTIWAVNSKGTGMGLPKPFGAHIIPSQGPDARRRVLMGFNVCPLGMWYCFSQILPCYSPTPPFGMGICTLSTIVCWGM